MRTIRRRPEWPNGPTGFEKKRPSRRLLIQAGVVVILLLFVLAIRDAQSPLGQDVQETLRSALTTEWDYQPVLDRMVSFGLQTVSVDMPFLGNVQPKDGGGQGGATPVTAPPDILALPVSGTVTRGYGWVVDPLDNLERFHPGIDISTAAATPVRAVLDGTVDQVAEDRAYGQYVLINHGEETYTLYAQVANIQVAAGDTVTAGQVIAEAAPEGEVGEAGIHFEYREQGELVDPLSKFEIPE